MGHIRWYEARNEIAEFAIPLIRQFQTSRVGYPAELLEEMGNDKLADQRWGEILADIEFALKSLISGENLTREQFDKRQCSLELFGKWFYHLWD